MRILGISAYYHDSAAALVVDGEVVACAQEERFTRIKGDASFPRNALAYCLHEGRTAIGDLDYVVFYDKPYIKFQRILETYLAFAPAGFHSFANAMSVWLGPKLDLEGTLRDELRGYGGPLLFGEHHESHAASAFFASPFADAAVLTMDGVGEWGTTAWGTGDGNTLELSNELRFPHSLGLLYSAFTEYIGFSVNSGEYKVMGLAPYGEPKYVRRILDHLIDLKPDGSFRLNMQYFDYCAGQRMTNAAFHRLFDAAPRRPESLLRQRDMDVARSIQDVTEEAILRMARHVRAETGKSRLCLAGGVALNAVANGRLIRERIFDELWVQPAAGDAGGALGAALYVWYQTLGSARGGYALTDGARPQRDAMHGALLGPEYADEEIARCLDACGAVYSRLSPGEVDAEVVRRLVSGKAVGWFQGRMEFGPRALGSRSILGDPRSPTMQKHMNMRIKLREGFRPFAPAVLAEDASDYFDLSCESPYMLLVAPVAERIRRPMSDEERRLWGIDMLNVPRSSIPAVTHVDYSARVQTVTDTSNARFRSLLVAWKDATGCSVLMNTSFNVRGEPIVCSPHDAYGCFMRTGIESLAIGSFLLDKELQPPLRDADTLQTVSWLD